MMKRRRTANYKDTKKPDQFYWNARIFLVQYYRVSELSKLDVDLLSLRRSITL